MKITVIVIGVIVAMILLLKLLGSSSKKKSRKSRPPAVKKVAAARAARATSPAQYNSAAIAPGPNACEAALALEGKRLLAGEIGTLPLADCTSPDCSCKYVRYDDRRSKEGDKRALGALSTELYEASGKTERRAKKKGRRSTDAP